MTRRTHRRTIEDRIAEQDDDYRKAMNTATEWANRTVGEDAPEDMHERRAQSVFEAEARDIEARRNGGDE